MNKTILFSILAITSLFLSSCNKERIQEKPHDLIEKDKMAEIIADSYIIENTILMAPEDSNKNIITVRLYDKLFKDYAITKDQYVTSIEYYLGTKESADQILKESDEVLKKKKEEFFITHTPDSTENRAWEDREIKK